MKIAILSGKGGTGKTTITGNLATFLKNCTMIDTDVEEPNSHLFFSMENKKHEKVYGKVPEIDESKCILCGKCSEFCKYAALFNTKKSILIFEESCHSCLGCEIVCDYGAINFKNREIGEIISGRNKEMNIFYGKLNIGGLSGVKIINRLKKITEDEKLLLIDCPPGTSCSTVAAVSDCDFALVVAEPTPFGVSDLKMVVEMLKKLKINFGVVINKAGLGNDEIYDYLLENKITLIEEIPFNEDVAKFYSQGKIFLEESEIYAEKFKNIYRKIEVLTNENK